MSQIVPFDWQDLPTSRALQRKIDNLPINAEAKLTLVRLGEVTAQAGERVIEVGRRILAFVLELMKHFPNLTLTLLAALTINALLVGVPILGPLLQPIFGPLLLAAGVGIGTVAELREGDMRHRMDAVVTEFQAIFA